MSKKKPKDRVANRDRKNRPPAATKSSKQPQPSLAPIDDIRDYYARETMSTFYVNLDAIVRRFSPSEYATFAAQKLASVESQPQLVKQIRPHHVLQSIEANCRFSMPTYHETVNDDRFAVVMNHYCAHMDPLQSGLLDDAKITHFFLVMHREQIEVQEVATQEEIARTREIFYSDNAMPKLSQEFEYAFGLSFRDWAQLCAYAAAAAQRNDTRTFEIGTLSDCTLHNIPPKRITAFLELISATPEQIGERFAKLRGETKPQFHGLIKSCFLDRPLVKISDDTFVAPHPPLILRSIGRGLYRSIKALRSFGIEFGRSVQAYIGKVLSYANEKIRTLTDSQLEQHSPGKSCDFLVEFPKCILLVESKATSFASDCLVDSVILQDGSTGKIANAIEQLYTTAHDARGGQFAALGVDGTKPIVGIVVTFGEIPFSNSEWYFETFISKRAGSKLTSPIFPSDAMQQSPIVLSIAALELLIVAMNSFPTGIVEIINEKKSRPYIETGDWREFLRSKIGALTTEPLQLPFVREQFESFWKEIGAAVPSPKG